MRIDPGNYDPDELRRLAESHPDDGRRDGRDGRGSDGFAAHDGDGARGGATRAGSRRAGSGARGRAAEALRTNQLEQLFYLQSAAGGLEKPYLRSLPQSFAAERVVFDWLEFLVLRGGFRGAFEALRYYHTIGWITEEVATELENYLVGLPDAPSGGEFGVDDHQSSLVYLARLASLAD